MKISKHSHGGLFTTLTINGKCNFIYGATPEEVEANYTEMKYKHQQGYNVNKNPLLTAYAAQWFNICKKGEGAIKTQKMYENCINNHICPAFEGKKLKDITATQAQNLLKSIKSSKSLAHKVRITLNQIFKQAMADRIISFNPIINCKVIAPDEPKRHFLNVDQRGLLLDILNGHRSYPLVFTLLYTGTRMGEILALLWKDIDFEKGIIKINKATEYEKSQPKRKDPKTKKGFREIPMPVILSEYIKQYKSNTKKGLYVFPGHAGGPMGLTEINRIWKKAQNKIIKWFKDNKDKPDNEKVIVGEFTLTFRLLRHTYCTGLYDSGVDEVSAAEIMGHNVGIMREIYTHIQESRKQKTIKKIDTIYEESKVIQMKESK
jgi:integrase